MSPGLKPIFMLIDGLNFSVTSMFMLKPMDLILKTRIMLCCLIFLTMEPDQKPKVMFYWRILLWSQNMTCFIDESQNLCFLNGFWSEAKVYVIGGCPHIFGFSWMFHVWCQSHDTVLERRYHHSLQHTAQILKLAIWVYS